MKTKDYFQTMCRYNHWMNEKLYTACAEIPDAIRKEDKGAFFRSIHGTLNHLLLADRLWLSRFTGQPFTFESLAQDLYSDFDTLWDQRRISDQALTRWIDALNDTQLNAPFSFHSVVQARDHSYPLWHLLMHVFNHQTHHRGQLTTLMTQSGYEPGVTDLLWLPGAELDAPT